MVNNGASGACSECKQRHKKCDGTRPSCLRCNRARRKCPGYNVTKELRFVNYTGEAKCNVLHNQSASSWHVSTPIESLDWPSIEHKALLEFFNGYCITSPNQSLSRGYLNGLQAMIAEAGSTSEIAKSCKIIALTNLGKKLGSPILIHAAENLHSSLLRSFRLSISNEAQCISAESLITAVLLGLYEIITCTTAHYGAHITHARGVSAILNSDSSPFDLMCGGKLFQIASPLRQHLEIDKIGSPHLQSTFAHSKMSSIFSVLCTPSTSELDSTIDALFTLTESLIRKADLLLASSPTTNQVRGLMVDAEKLNKGYDMWPKQVSDEWWPRSVGVIALKDDSITPNVGYWPVNVSDYHDPYIASIWNSYRKARLFVLNLIVDCHQRLQISTQEHEISVYKEIEVLIEGVVSSIPFLLAADLNSFLQNSTIGTPAVIPGRPVGGLLLMHTLVILSTLPIVEMKLKVYIRDCLAWIGDEMGIGQATLLSKCKTLDLFDYVMEAHVVIWAGMLI